MKKYLRVIFVLPLLLAAASDLYETIGSIKTDPKLKAAFDAFKLNPDVAPIVSRIENDAATLKRIVSELS